MILLPILRVTLGSDSALPPGALPPRTPESIIFLRNFNDFASLTEAQLKLIFCEPAWWLSPQDPQNP